MKEKFNFEKEKDLISGIFFLILSVIIFFAACNIETTSSLQYGGSKLIPWIASGTMFLCGIFVTIDGLKKHKAEKTDVKPKERKIWRVAAVLLMLAVYIFMMTRIGFLIATVLFLGALIWFMAREDQRKPVKVVIIAVLSGVIIYFLFTKGFGLALPIGRWIT